MPVRIYDIAKRLGVESKAVLAKAKELGITGARVPSSSLDKITAEYLVEQMGGAPKPEPEPPPPAPEPIVIVTAPEEEPPTTTEAAPAEAVAAETAPAGAETLAAATAEVVSAEPASDLPVAEGLAEPARETAEAAPGEVEAPPEEPEPEPEPEEPPAPKIGEKVGFIQLPPRPVSRTAAGRTPARATPKAPKAAPKPAERPAAPAARDRKFAVGPEAEVVTLKPPIVVRDLAEKINRKPFQVIADLMEQGIFATVNQAIEEAAAQQVCAKHGFRFELEKRERGGGTVHAPKKPVEVDLEDSPKDLELRAPVVTIMGHVDHGKTTLLDRIRQSNVVARESGGITQHIGAYTISIPHPERKKDLQQITFLDTPGHAAFSAMRARGANVTDIVVLVVAANDGVMPQTMEALSHAKAAGVPIIVAVNKCDHPNAVPLRVRQQLQERDLTCEEWGGSTIFVDLSATTGQGVDKLLEMLVLQAEIMELKANPNRPAKGNVIESGIEPGGPTATLLVRKGTLRVGSIVLCGHHYGRVRALLDEDNKRLKEAGPSMAVKVLGLNGVPEAGTEFTVFANEKDARAVAEERAQQDRVKESSERQPLTVDDLLRPLDDQTKVLSAVVKADMQGSAEAIVEALNKIESKKVSLKVIHQGVGAVSESDVLLAAASKALIIGFHVRVENTAAEAAKREGVRIQLYSIIYELIDQVKEAMAGLLDPVTREVVTGAAEVRKIFTLSKGGQVAGCVVTSGRIARGRMRLVRRRSVIFEGNSLSLRRFQDEVNEVRSGMDCGIRLDGFQAFEEGDVIECYALERVAQSL